MRSLSVFGLLLTAVLLFSTPALAKDEWVTVRSKNFFLVGNASQKDIEKVAVKMEQFRETFHLLFSSTQLSTARPTNIIVFKNAAAYKPFLPRRTDGTADTEIAGYFQSGDDVNYITLAVDGDDESTYHTIFHEYVHSIIDATFGRSEIPAWLNEGLAEYYSTFKVEKGNEVYIGYPILEHAHFIADNGMLPLKSLFAASNQDIHSNPGRTRQAFYAESWALVHCLLTTGKSRELSQFVAALQTDVPPEEAFIKAFGMSYLGMENVLHKYVTQASFNYQVLTLKDQISFASSMTSASVDDGKANAYLGDLLCHTDRVDEAEPYLLKALVIDPASLMANTSLGMAKIRQRKFPEARKYLDAALASGGDSYLPLYWSAKLILEQNSDQLGEISSLSAEDAAKARDLLARAIRAKPDSAESADLFAYVALLKKDGLDEALAAIESALKFQPGDQALAMRSAEILAAKEQFDRALAIAKKVADNSDDPELRSRATRFASILTTHIRLIKVQENRVKAAASANANAGPPVLRTGGITSAEADRLALLMRNNGITEMLPKPGTDDVAALGHFKKIACVGGGVQYTFATDGGDIVLSTKDFQSLDISTFSRATSSITVGCSTDLSAARAYITYRKKAAGTAARGTLLSIAIVPDDFEIVEKLPEAPDASAADVPASDQPGPKEMTKEQRQAMLESVRQYLRPPEKGEERRMGFIEKMSCSESGAILFVSTADGTLQFSIARGASPPIAGFATDAKDLTFGCQMGRQTEPAIVTYRLGSSQKAGVLGEIVNLEFVPKDFQLQDK